MYVHMIPPMYPRLSSKSRLYGSKRVRSLERPRGTPDAAPKAISQKIQIHQKQKKQRLSRTSHNV